MARVLKNARIVTGHSEFRGALAICGDRIGKIWRNSGTEEGCPEWPGDEKAVAEISQPWDKDVSISDLHGLVLMAGAIDSHVHFREPGMTAKADLESESKAALLGGVTSFIDMPNTKPATTDKETLEAKLSLSEGRCWANYGFHLGATNANQGHFEDIDPHSYAGVKVFLGSSTGGLLVDDASALRNIFRTSGKEVLIHSEDNDVIAKNLARYRAEYGDELPFRVHPLIRSAEACSLMSRKALDLAAEYGTRLHLLHVSTAIEAQMVKDGRKENPYLTCETSPNYLWFSERDYDTMGAFIKCNPAVKQPSDRAALRRAIKDGTIDTIGTDHAPHLISEKMKSYLSSPSGVCSIQQSLAVMMSVAGEEGLPYSRIAALMSENPASLFGIRDRGFIAEGAIADLVVIDPEMDFTVGDEKDMWRTSSARIDSKCGWSAYGPVPGKMTGERLRGGVRQVWLGGVKAVEDGRLLLGEPSGKRLIFDR